MRGISTGRFFRRLMRSNGKAEHPVAARPWRARRNHILAKLLMRRRTLRNGILDTNNCTNNFPTDSFWVLRPCISLCSWQFAAPSV